jgi:hypothetical protein
MISYFFSIPFYLLLNSIVSFRGGIVWSIIHILPMDGIVNSLNILYFSQMLFVIPNLFFQNRTWISGKGWFAILSHSIWNLSIFSVYSFGIGKIRGKCIQNFQIDHLIGYIIIYSILIMLIYFIYNSRRRQEEFETNMNILFTDNNNREECQEKVADKHIYNTMISK